MAWQRKARISKKRVFRQLKSFFSRKTLANFEYVFVNGVKVEVEFNLANRMVNSQVVIDKNLRCEILAIQHKPARIMLRRQTETAPRRTNRKPPARRSTIAARAEPIQPTIPVPTEPAHNDAVGNVEIADLHDDFDDFDDAQMDFDGGDGLNNINPEPAHNDAVGKCSIHGASGIHVDDDDDGFAGANDIVVPIPEADRTPASGNNVDDDEGFGGANGVAVAFVPIPEAERTPAQVVPLQPFVPFYIRGRRRLSAPASVFL